MPIVGSGRYPLHQSSPTNHINYPIWQFSKLPFGISSDPELFQNRMSIVLESIPGVLCLIDDTIVFGATQEVHDERLERSLQRQ